MATVFEIQLKRLHVRENGDIRRKEATNALTLGLVYPSPEKPLVSTVKNLKLVDDQEIDFETGKRPGTNDPYTWSDRIVFKEALLRSTQLVAQLTDVERASKLDRFFAGLFKNIFKALWDLASGGIANVVLAAVVDSVGAEHLDSLEVGGNTVNIIGRAEISLTEAGLPPEGQSRDLQLALVVPKDVSTTIAYFDAQHRIVRTNETVLEEGTNNGTLTLTLTNLGPA